MDRRKIPKKVRVTQKVIRKQRRRAKWRRWLLFARDSLEANINQFFDHLDTALSFRILHVCYGLIMLALFYTIALHLIHHLEARREKALEAQTSEIQRP